MWYNYQMRNIYWLFIFLFLPFTALAQADLDSDQDGLTDQQEINIYYTDPDKADTDNDTFSDGTEVNSGYSPLLGDNKKMIQADSDKDGLNDAWELTLGTGLMNQDSDNDGYQDGIEVISGHDPLNPQPIKVEKLIKVNLASQRLEYYFGGKTLGSFAISGGVKSMPTPKGNFTVLKKIPLKNYGGANYYYPNTKWNLNFYNKKYGYYIHGAYWHNKFGQPMSHGCVNVSYENMEPLYNWAQVGTKVVIE